VFDDWEDTKWLFEELRTDRSVLDLIGKKRTVAAKTLRKELQKMHQNGDKGFLCNFLYNYLSKEQRD
jgi:hypothetical protein